MEDRSYPIDSSLQRLLAAKDVTQGDLLEIREILRGGSVIDWSKLHFRSIPAVNEFLKVFMCDPANVRDMERIQQVHRDAAEYLKTTLEISIPSVLAHPHRIQNLFLYASAPGKHRAKACTLLKVMYVLNHLEARQLLFNLPISERELFSRVEKRVKKTVMRMVELGFAVEDYVASQKTKEGLVTKVLSKREGTAAQVFDRIRFRIIVSHKKQLLPVLYHLKRRLFPFPCVIPGESSNNIDPFQDLVREAFGLRVEGSEVMPASIRSNEFSHRDYKVIHFVADIPVRVQDIIEKFNLMMLSRFGNTVFVPTEFQVFDTASHFLNEAGPAAHSLYKSRQVREVISRLYSGTADEGKEDQSD